MFFGIIIQYFHEWNAASVSGNTDILELVAASHIGNQSLHDVLVGLKVRIVGLLLFRYVRLVLFCLVGRILLRFFGIFLFRYVGRILLRFVGRCAPGAFRCSGLPFFRLVGRMLLHSVGLILLLSLIRCATGAFRSNGLTVVRLVGRIFPVGQSHLAPLSRSMCLWRVPVDRAYCSPRIRPVHGCVHPFSVHWSCSEWYPL